MKNVHFHKGLFCQLSKIVFIKWFHIAMNIIWERCLFCLIKTNQNIIGQCKNVMITLNDFALLAKNLAYQDRQIPIIRYGWITKNRFSRQLYFQHSNQSHLFLFYIHLFIFVHKNNIWSLFFVQMFIILVSNL